MPSNQLVFRTTEETVTDVPARRAARPKPRRRRREPAPLMRSAATSYVAAKSVSLVARQAFDEQGRLTARAENWLTKAVTVQRPVVMANLRRLRKAHPTLTHRQLASQLDKEFKLAMTGSGALIGATAAVPRVGPVASLGISAASTGGFLELSAIYAQSMAELSGISTEDPTRAKLLVMGVMLGEQGRQLLGELAAQADGRGNGPINSLVPLAGIANGGAGASTMAGMVAQQIRRQFVRRFFIRQGTSMLARAVPYGIGAVVGGVGNRALSSQIITTAHSTFGQLPEDAPQALVDDLARGLEREKLRADRKERRDQKREVLNEARQQRRAQAELRRETEGPSVVMRQVNRLRRR